MRWPKKSSVLKYIAVRSVLDQFSNYSNQNVKLWEVNDGEHKEIIWICQEREGVEFGDLMFKKEFYSSAMCLMENGEEVRLKKFARSWLEVTETGDDATEKIEIACADTQIDDDWIP